MAIGKKFVTAVFPSPRQAGLAYHRVMGFHQTFASRAPRMIPALVCLLGVCLMQAPLVLAEWSISTGMCCTGSSCPIAAHHHKKAASAAAYEMDCGHDMNSMAACTMSCCHDQDQATVTASIFVMPPVTSFGAPNAVVAAVEVPGLPEFLRSIEPKSPPPRNFSFGL